MTLEERIQALEEQVFMLRERLGAFELLDGPVQFTALGIRPREARVLHVLVAAAMPMSGAQIHQAIYGGRFHGADQCNVRHVIADLRVALRPRGIEIAGSRTRPGYFIPPDHKAKLARAISQTAH